jgi:hypothetical protein
MRPRALLLLIVALIPATSHRSEAQEVEELKKGVVKITARVEGKARIGTGFIARLDKDAAYVVTASHVIEGDPQPEVTFFTQPARSFGAKVIGIEGGDPKGLAVLLVSGSLPSNLRRLAIDQDLQVKGGEGVTIIGFPSLLATPWTVSTGTISGLKGRELTFQGPVEEGNSGGPVLFDGRVVGVVTEARGTFGYAVPASMIGFVLTSWRIELAPEEVAGPDGVRMVLVPAGVFKMGREAQQVYLDAFYIDKALDVRADSPAQGSNWLEAQKHCHRLNKRLATEAEWEKAARGSYVAAGGAPEWVADWYQKDYPEVRSSRNPIGPSTGESNDGQLEKYDLQTREKLDEQEQSNQRLLEQEREREREMRSRSSYYIGGQIEFLLYRQRDARARLLSERKQKRPRTDQMKVVRDRVDGRRGVFSMEIVAFRCARDAR